MTDEKNTKLETQAEEIQDVATVSVADDKSQEKKGVKQSKYIRTAKGKKRAARQVPRGRAYIHASINNTIISITDQNGNAIAWASAGNCGFKGPKKSTPYAASQVVEKLTAKVEPYGIKELAVYVCGIGNGRDSAIRSLNTKGFNIVSIKDITPVPHNGCRPRRARRI